MFSLVFFRAIRMSKPSRQHKMLGDSGGPSWAPPAAAPSQEGHSEGSKKALNKLMAEHELRLAQLLLRFILLC